MANHETDTYDGEISGNILVLGSSASRKTTVAQEMASNYMFSKLKGSHWISRVKLSKQREAELGSCFEPKFEFCYPWDERDVEKTFWDLENQYREKREKLVAESVGNGREEYVERDNFIALNDVTDLTDRSHSFVNFLTSCRKFAYSVIYISRTCISSPRWKDIISQKQIFYVCSSAMDLVLNHLVKFVTRGSNAKGYLSRQQLGLKNENKNLQKENLRAKKSICKDILC